MHPYSYNLTLRITHSSIKPSEMMGCVGFEPMVYWVSGNNKITNNKKGDFYKKTSNEFNYCCFAVSVPGEGGINDGLEYFLSEIDQKKDFLISVSETGGKVELSIGWYINGNAGFAIDREVLMKLAMLRVGLLFDVYD